VPALCAVRTAMLGTEQGIREFTTNQIAQYTSGYGMCFCLLPLICMDVVGGVHPTMLQLLRSRACVHEQYFHQRREH